MTGTQTFVRVALCALATLPSLSACGGGGAKSGSAEAVASGQPGAAGTIENRSAAKGQPAPDTVASSKDAPAQVRRTVSMAIPSSPQPRPPELLVSLTIPAPDRDLSALRSYVDAIQPGTADRLPFSTPDDLLTFLTDSGLSGLDPGKPIFALLVSPRQYPNSWVLIGTVARGASVAPERQNLAVFHHGGRVAIGDPDVLERVGAYAFSNFLAGPTAGELTVTVHTDALRSYLKMQIDAAMDMFNEQAAHDPDAVATAEFFRSFIALVTQSDRFDMSLSALGSSATLSFELVPKPGSPFATTVAGEVPARFSLVGELPPGPIVMAGHTTSQDLSDAMARLQGNRASPLLDAATQAEIQRHGKVFRDAVKGEYAVSMAIARERGAYIAGVWETIDNKAAVGAVNAVMFGVLGKLLKRYIPTLRPKKRSFRHKRVKLSELRFPLPKKMPAEMRQIVEKLAGKRKVSVVTGGASQRALMVIGKDARQRAKRLVEGALKARTDAPAPAVASVLADARKRKENMLAAVDIQTVIADLGIGQAPAGGGDWAVFGLSFSRGSIAGRFTLPAGATRAALMLAMAGF